MTPKTLEELMKLSPSEREELVTPDWDDYVDAGDGPVARLEIETPEFFAELDRRSAEAKANPGSGIPWSEVKRKLDAIIAEDE
jgi:putative addiction module component (TIGR02574 family)